MQKQSSDGRTLSPVEAPPSVFHQTSEFFVLEPAMSFLIYDQAEAE